MSSRKLMADELVVKSEIRSNEADRMLPRQRREKVEKDSKQAVAPANQADLTQLLTEMRIMQEKLSQVQTKFEESQTTISALRSEVATLKTTVSSSNEASVVDASETASLCWNDVPEPQPTSQEPISDSNVPKPQPSAIQQPIQATVESRQTIKEDLNLQPGFHNQEMGFVKVEQKKRPKIVVTAQVTPNPYLRADVHTTQLYLSQVNQSVKTKHLVDFLKQKTGHILRIEQLDSGNDIGKSFLVRVPTENLKMFLSNEFWPGGLRVRKFQRKAYEAELERKRMRQVLLEQENKKRVEALQLKMKEFKTLQVTSKKEETKDSSTIVPKGRDQKPSTKKEQATKTNQGPR